MKRRDFLATGLAGAAAILSKDLPFKSEAKTGSTSSIAVETDVERQVDELLKRLSLEEKVQFLRGDDNFSSRGNERLGIPGISMSDGPQGVRVEGPATVFPSPVAMAASWDVELIERVGAALGSEVRAKGRDMLLGPCVNIHRSPLGGRNTESFGEDPYLAGKIAAAYIKGVQSRRVAACVKHFAANNLETRRLFLDVEADQRFLHEIEFPAFKRAVREGGALAVMASYNKVNGHYSWANRYLLTEVLRKQWNYQGIVVSDWGCEWMLPEERRTVESVDAGLNIHMPNGYAYGEPLVKAVMSGQVSAASVDELVKRVLIVIYQLGLVNEKRPDAPAQANTKEHQQLAREVAASSIVLLKNDGATLPLNRRRLKSIAVIGPNADVARLGDRASAYAPTPYTVSPLQGLRTKLGEAVAIRHVRGYDIREFFSVPESALLPLNGRRGERGLRGEYFAGKEVEGTAAFNRIDRTVNFNWGMSAPGATLKADRFAARWSGRLLPDKSGVRFLGLRSNGVSRLYIDDRLFIENVGSFVGAVDPSAIRFARLDLRVGHARDIRVEYVKGEGEAKVELLWAGVPADPFHEAVEAARGSDLALVFAGLNTDYEGEGLDRFSMDLPELQDELILAVARANPRTVVAINSGTPNHMLRWIERVPAVLQVWYPGMEGGNAIADVLFGDVNPSGKLPVTFGRRREDYADYPTSSVRDDAITYGESLFVGYRHFDAQRLPPLFPFGHGLSFTTFAYENLSARSSGKDGVIEVSVDVKNTGRVEGTEVVQLYIGGIESKRRTPRPPKELKGFRRVKLASGESAQVSFRLKREDLSFYEPERAVWTTTPEGFEIMIGSSSRDIRLRQRFGGIAKAVLPEERPHLSAS